MAFLNFLHELFPPSSPTLFFIKHLRCCQKVLTFFTHSLIIDFVVLSKFNCYVPEVRKLKWSELSSLFLKWFSLDRKILFKDNCDFHLTLPFHVFFFLHPCSNPTLKKKKKNLLVLTFSNPPDTIFFFRPNGGGDGDTYFSSSHHCPRYPLSWWLANSQFFFYLYVCVCEDYTWIFHTSPPGFHPTYLSFPPSGCIK